MKIIREKTACFTGHRPEKLPCGGISSANETGVIKSILYKEILAAADDGYDTFITGMQRGIDLWAGEIVLELACMRGLKIAAVLPYRDFGKNFKGADKWTFCRIIDRACSIVIISESYTPASMNLRNRFMVDNSSRVIAFMSNEKSGTGQTVRYARKQGVEVRMTDLDRLFQTAPELNYNPTGGILQ